MGVDGTGLGSCRMAGFGFNVVEPSGFGIEVLDQQWNSNPPFDRIITYILLYLSKIFHCLFAEFEM
jgi:hypothetical protein